MSKKETNKNKGHFCKQTNSRHLLCEFMGSSLCLLYYPTLSWYCVDVVYKLVNKANIYELMLMLISIPPNSLYNFEHDNKNSEREKKCARVVSKRLPFIWIKCALCVCVPISLPVSLCLWISSQHFVLARIARKNFQFLRTFCSAQRNPHGCCTKH